MLISKENVSRLHLHIITKIIICICSIHLCHRGLGIRNAFNRGTSAAEIKALMEFPAVQAETPAKVLVSLLLGRRTKAVVEYPLYLVALP